MSPEPKKKIQVKKGDTLVALALKFGVSVNQIFFWNPHLVPLPDLGGKVSLARSLARTHPPTHERCHAHTCARSRARSRLLLRLNHLV
jgi:LysM repeat protein